MLYPTLLFIHIAAVLVFVGVHGVSAWVSLHVQNAREREQLAPLLNLSQSTYPWMFSSLGVILLSGIALGIAGGWWRHAWFWASLMVFIALGAGMGAVGNRYRALRSVMA